MITAPDFRRMKAEGRKVVAVTAYDFTFSRLLDQAGVDLLLVGDSLGMVIQGGDSTLPVTLDEMIYHGRAVVRGSQNAMVVVDLPFGSYQEGIAQAFATSARVLKESGAQAVKLEGGVEMAATVAHLVAVGIPVLGHVGLMPQRVHAMGGFRIQGRGQEEGERVLADARALVGAGVFALVLEGIPAPLAGLISREVDVPTIGIGAGPLCDGQVLVCYDLLGIHEGKSPYKFVKEYLDGGVLIREAAGRFAEEVRSGRFPLTEHSFQ